MSQNDITDPYRAPHELVKHYVRQVYPHNTPTDNPLNWAKATSNSYVLWLSYAKFKVESSRGSHQMKSYEVTQATAEEEEYLKTADEVYVNVYITWAIPVERQEQYKNEGGHLKDLVTPVHFKFFMLCYHREPRRPLGPSTVPDDFFFHPIFTLDRYNGPPALILPTYFFNPSAKFNELTDPEYQPYIIFPFFAKILFEWLKKDGVRGDFPSYYRSWYAPWTPRAGAQNPPTLARPHAVFKKYWRWAEVLWMLEEDAQYVSDKQFNCPKTCTAVPPHETIDSYLGLFAAVALSWFNGRIKNAPGN